MKTARFPGLTLIGAVRGPMQEGEEVLAEVIRAHPSRIALDLSPEELWGLKEHFGAGGSEPLAPLLQSESALAMALSAYGEVRLPSPSFVLPVRWGVEHERELLALDPDEDEYSSLFLKNVGYLDLVRRARAEHALTRSSPQVDSPEELVIQWEERLHRGKGSQKLLEARLEHLVERLQELGKDGGSKPLLAILDIEHWQAVKDALSPA